MKRLQLLIPLFWATSAFAQSAEEPGADGPDDRTAPAEESTGSGEDDDDDSTLIIQPTAPFDLGDEPAPFDLGEEPPPLEVDEEPAEEDVEPAVEPSDESTEFDEFDADDEDDDEDMFGPAPQAEDSAPAVSSGDFAYDGTATIFVSPFQPRNPEAAGLAGMMSAFLESQLSANSELKVIPAYDAPPVHDMSAEVYLESCPPGQAVGCAFVVGEVADADYAVTVVCKTAAGWGVNPHLG